MRNESRFFPQREVSRNQNYTSHNTNSNMKQPPRSIGERNGMARSTMRSSGASHPTNYQMTSDRRNGNNRYQPQRNQDYQSNRPFYQNDRNNSRENNSSRNYYYQNRNNISKFADNMNVPTNGRGFGFRYQKSSTAPTLYFFMIF